MPGKKHPDALPHEIDEAMENAWSCFSSFRKQPGKDRARLLRSIARHVEESKDKLVSAADFETSLGHERLQFELKRTISELELFAKLAESEKWKELREEQSERNRNPPKKPSMQTANVPLGPVVVIGACNFPFAISVVGTDTASALAVGCPVVVKAHPDHARACQALTEAVQKALLETGMPEKYLPIGSWYRTLGHPGLDRTPEDFMRGIHRFAQGWKRSPRTSLPTPCSYLVSCRNGKLEPQRRAPRHRAFPGRQLDWDNPRPPEEFGRRSRTHANHRVPRRTVPLGRFPSRRNTRHGNSPRRPVASDNEFEAHLNRTVCLSSFRSAVLPPRIP
jgi:hypothetical protein